MKKIQRIGLSKTLSLFFLILKILTWWSLLQMRNSIVKNILSARCEVFKNTLAPNTIESESSTIQVKEVPSEAVESMLKYIYSGEIPDDRELLTLDLLNIAEMYLLDHLKEACVKSLVERLEVSTCISTFIMADRYLPSGGT